MKIFQGKKEKVQEKEVKANMSYTDKDLKEVQEVFFKDARWSTVEQLIYEYINPLLDMSTIDTTQPAEHVKAEIIGRRLAYDKLYEFISQSKLVGHARPHIINSPFR